MKNELILLACMTAGPYLLNSAGQRADTIEKNSRMGSVSSTMKNSNSYQYSWFDVFDQYNNPATYIPTTYTADCGSKPSVDPPLSRTLQHDNKALSKSSIQANWVLDTLASAYNEMLVYKDKDEPGLKAILFTDDAGNMLLQLEQDGKSREIRVQKVEFHTPANIKPRKHKLNKWMKNDLSVQKGAVYVPV